MEKIFTEFVESIHIRPGRLIYSKGSASDALF